jgi:hypothetical protein
MIDSENWDKLEMFIESGAPELAIPHLVKEVQQQLTPEQLLPLGDLTETFLGIFSKKTDTPARKFIAFFIDMAQKGVIKKKP